MKTADFISSLRNAETQELQRELISAELSSMRTLSKSDTVKEFPKIVLKLIYLSLLGEKTDWGQVITINLMASSSPSYKLIGYLGTQLIVDQTTELSVLIMHTVSKDLNSDSLYLQYLALCLIANSGLPEMCKSVATRVAQLLDSGNPKILKCALATAYRIVSLIPETATLFEKKITSLLTNESHCVVLAGNKLAIQLHKLDNDKHSNMWRQISLNAQRLLKKISQLATPNPEYVLLGISDPFLQCSLLGLIAEIGIGTPELSDTILTIVTNLDLKKFACRSILFQAMSTIDKCFTDDHDASQNSLRTMGLNQVGKVLSSTFTSSVYSALACFTRLLYQNEKTFDRNSRQSQALSRYQDIIVKYLYDPDHSIRKRALDVISALINESNIETLSEEIFKALKLADIDFKSEIVFKFFIAIQRFAPNKQWNFDTVLRLILENGNYIGNEMITQLCNMIGSCPDMHEFWLPALDEQLQLHPTNQVLVQVSSWALGEFFYEYDYELVDMLLQVFYLPETSEESKMYLLISVAKLTVRMAIADVLPVLEDIKKDNSFIVQQLAGELYNILSNEDLAETLLQPIEYDTKKESSSLMRIASSLSNSKLRMQDSLPGALLLNQAGQSIAHHHGLEQRAHILPQKSADITPILKKLPAHLDPSLINQLFGAPSSQKLNIPPNSVEVFRNTDFVIYFEVTKNRNNEKQVAIRSSSFNLLDRTIFDFKLQFGVPVGWFVKAREPSGFNLFADGNPVQQVFILENQGTHPLKMKVQSQYQLDGKKFSSLDPINYDFTK